MQPNGCERICDTPFGWTYRGLLDTVRARVRVPITAAQLHYHLQHNFPYFHEHLVTTHACTHTFSQAPPPKKVLRPLKNSWSERHFNSSIIHKDVHMHIHTISSSDKVLYCSFNVIESLWDNAQSVQQFFFHGALNVEPNLINS